MKEKKPVVDVFISRQNCPFCGDDCGYTKTRGALARTKLPDGGRSAIYRVACKGCGCIYKLREIRRKSNPD